jgi:hypothetical protein
MKSILAIFGILALTLHPAGAAEIKRWESASGDTVITISGKLKYGDERRFSLLTFGVTKATVELESGGGNLLAALSIGKELRRNGFSTVVKPGKVCASACGLIWLAGTPPIMDGQSYVGLHSTFDASSADRPASLRGNLMVREYLRGLGYKDKLARYATLSGPYEMKWVNFLDARTHGIEFSTELQNLDKRRKPLPTP